MPGTKQTASTAPAATTPGQIRLSSCVAMTERSTGSTSLPRLLTNTAAFERAAADTPEAPNRSGKTAARAPR